MHSTIQRPRGHPDVQVNYLDMDGEVFCLLEAVVIDDVNGEALPSSIWRANGEGMNLVQWCVVFTSYWGVGEPRGEGRGRGDDCNVENQVSYIEHNFYSIHCDGAPSIIITMASQMENIAI